MKRFLAVCLALCLAMALFAVPVFAEGAAEPTGSGDTFFANGTPITIQASEPSEGTQVTLSDFTKGGTAAFIVWEDSGQTKYVGVSADANVYGGKDGRREAVSVPNTSITMTGGTVRCLIGGNLGANANTPLATVTGNVTMRISGDAKVSTYIAGGGRDNACVNGTVSLTLDRVDLGGYDPLPYVHGGVWGHGNEGTRNIENGTMNTQAVANRVEIVVTGSQNIPPAGRGRRRQHKSEQRQPHRYGQHSEIAVSGRYQWRDRELRSDADQCEYHQYGGHKPRLCGQRCGECQRRQHHQFLYRRSAGVL